VRPSKLALPFGHTVTGGASCFQTTITLGVGRVFDVRVADGRIKTVATVCTGTPDVTRVLQIAFVGAAILRAMAREVLFQMSCGWQNGELARRSFRRAKQTEEESRFIVSGHSIQ